MLAFEVNKVGFHQFSIFESSLSYLMSSRAIQPKCFCLLLRLDIGEESPIKEPIAEFTGVLYGSSWRLVQLAAAHLSEHL